MQIQNDRKTTVTALQVCSAGRPMPESDVGASSRSEPWPQGPSDISGSSSVTGCSWSLFEYYFVQPAGISHKNDGVESKITELGKSMMKLSETESRSNPKINSSKRYFF